MHKLMTGIVSVIVVVATATMGNAQQPNKALEERDRLHTKPAAVPDRALGIHTRSNIGQAFENRGKLYPRRSYFDQGIVSGEFPIGSTREYLYRANLYVGIPGNVIQGRFSVNEEWEAAGGYHNRDSARVATSTKPSTWPATGWPLRDAHGDPRFVSDEDTYCVYNDSANSKDLLLLEVHQTGYAFSADQFKNAVFFTYQIVNRSSRTYDSLYFGMYIDIDVGSRSGSGGTEYADDKVDFDRALQLAYFYDDGYTADWAGNTTGYFGVTVISTPADDGTETGVTDFHYNLYEDDQDVDTVQYGILSSARTLYESAIGPKYFHPGTNAPDLHFDDPATIPAEGLDIVATLGSGPYRSVPGDTLTFVTALVAGSTYEDIIQSAQSAHDLARDGFVTGGTKVPPDIEAFRAEPKGEQIERREGVLDGNRIRTLFNNAGEIGSWPNSPSGEWPKGTGHTYLDGYCLLVAASVVAPGTGSLIHPLETYYREEMDYNPYTGEMWGFNPVPGYTNPSDRRPALSIDPATWPTSWEGKWKGMAGTDSVNASFETYFVMDDSKDGEWSQPPHNFFPVLTDSGRQGLGLRVEARGFQWADSVARDILIYRYEIVNISDYDYDSTVVGVYMDPGVGGSNNLGNSARYDDRDKVVYSWNPSGLGVPGNWPTGYLGLAFLETPAREPAGTEPIGMSNCAIELLSDKGPTSMWPKNDEVMWMRMTGGIGDSIVENTNISIVASSGPFALKKWSRVHFATTLVFAESLGQVLPKVAIAREIAAGGYRLSGITHVDGDTRAMLPTEIALYQNYPNPFNPSTRIRYELPERSHVTLTVFNTLGQQVAKLVEGEMEAGYHEVRLNASHLASGVYLYQLRAGAFVQTCKLVILR